MSKGVCCFTTDPMNDVMRAHYADNHKGVCLEFELSTTPFLNDKLIPVSYSDEFPVAHKMDDLIDALRTKKTVWSYEKEWRIIGEPDITYKFNKPSLTGITFGYHLEDQ